MQYCLFEAGELHQAEKEADNASYAKLDSLRNAAKRNTMMKNVQRNGGLKNAIETLRTMMYGSNKFARDNIQTAWHSQREKYQAALDNQLFKAGLKKVAQSGAIDKDISIAWWKINAGESAGTGPAAEIAKLFSKTMDGLRDKLNKSGARIGDATDYVMKTTHDSIRMRQAAGAAKTLDEAFGAWWQKTEPRLSEKTFEGVKPKEGDLLTPAETIPQARARFGRSVFDSLLTGIHMTAGGAAETGFIPAVFEGTHNIARRLSQDRTLLWKDAESWHEHMQDFGQYHNLNMSVNMSIDRATRSAALMDRMGTNPTGNLNLLIRRIQETYRNDADGIRDFQSKIHGVQNVMGRLDGSLNIPANMGFSTYAAALRTWESVSSLGGVGITHFASIWPTVSSELVHHGVNRIEGISNTFKAVFTGMGDQQYRDILSDLGAHADGAMRHMSGIVGDDTVPGKISAMANRFMDMTGIHILFDRTKAGVRDLLAHNLGRNVDKAWQDLDPHISNMLGKYGITAEDWASLKGAELPKYNDRAYLVPSAADTLRPGLGDKLLSYYSDASAHAVVTAGVREKAMILGNTRPGTMPGEFLRFFAQFKMWPLAAMNQVLERDIYMSLSQKEAAFNIGALLAIGIPAGYMRMSANDAISGHPLRDPTKPATLLAAAAQSGGLGILGDFLFGETNRMGGGIIPTLGGPVASDADSLVKIFNEWKQGKAGWPDLAHFGVRHIPFANLAYLKGGLDYMLWYHLYEAASPGWWERTNRRLEKEQGRTMTGYIPGKGVPFGIPGIHLGGTENGSNQNK